MGKKGGSGHLKREASPRFWPIHRKSFTWSVKPKPGPHGIYECLPLQIIIREILGYANTRSEVKKIVSQSKLLVDGKIRKDEHFAVGLMDVITIPEIKRNFRMLPTKKGLALQIINDDEAKFKLCRVENKKTIDIDTIQLNLHDGRNILIGSDTSEGLSLDNIGLLDTLKIGIPGQEIIEHLKIEKGNLALFIGGKNEGKYGTITSIEEQSSHRRQDLLITIENERGQSYQTTLYHAFVIGDISSRISLPSLEV